MLAPLIDRMTVDIQRRAQVLPDEVTRWKDLANQDAGSTTITVGKKGIYQSQIEALKIMMDGLQNRQTELLKLLRPDATPEAFASNYLELSDEIVSAHEIWRIFRYIIALHKDANLGPLVDAAGLIARDCYLTCMNKARDWQLVDENQFRAPPLVYLEAEMLPSTASRGYAAQSLGFPLRRYRNMVLPIPLILLPSDNASSMWLFSTLHHEVGHNLDQDLNLKKDLSGTAFLIHLKNKNVPDERQQNWFNWIGEILADAFGIMLGGAGFAHALSWLLLVMAPEPKFQTLNVGDKHPPFYVRVNLLIAMLRWFKVNELNEAADLIQQTWDAMQKPDWVAHYTLDTETVADFFFTQKLPALGKRSISELAPDMSDDVRRVADLQRYLRSGLGPDPNLPASATWRHVPLAAQMAFINMQNPTPERLDQIQQRAMGYLADIPRPNKMSGGTGTSDFFSGLMRDLKLS